MGPRGQHSTGLSLQPSECGLGHQGLAQPGQQWVWDYHHWAWEGGFPVPLLKYPTLGWTLGSPRGPAWPPAAPDS